MGMGMGMSMGMGMGMGWGKDSGECTYCVGISLLGLIDYCCFFWVCCLGVCGDYVEVLCLPSGALGVSVL